MKNPKIIEADDRAVGDVLSNKFIVDYFQREYNWQRKHVEQLISDLEDQFKANYDKNHERKEVANYSRYFLGPIVLSVKDGSKSIVDGQQRLTTLTLLLINLLHLLKNNEIIENWSEIISKISPLIYSEKYGEKSFNLQVKDREKCMKALYDKGEYTANELEMSEKNIIERYKDIEEIFPQDLKGKALPYFIDWLTNNVILVEILTYSDEDAYTIFETMNDRGLNLTSTEMLKGYLLSLIKDEKEKHELNGFWKEKISELKKLDKGEDSEFFKAWLRAKYAKSMRSGKKGTSNKDFEKIGTKFHSWVRDNKSKISLKNSKDIYHFIKEKFNFYEKQYLKIYASLKKLNPGLESIYVIGERGLASSLYLPLLLSPIKLKDDEKTIKKKLALVSYYLELFVVLRSINRRNYSHSSIRYTMYNLIKEIRDADVEELSKILKKKASEFEDTLKGIKNLILHGQNKRFIKFFLARITNYIEEQSGVPSSFEDYTSPNIKKPFEIEHIWADKFEEHRDEFEQRDEFEKWRNKIGALVLVQRGFNQSYGDMKYEEKLPHYYGQNLLAKSLNPKCYEKNPNFMNFVKKSNLPFKPHKHFTKGDIQERQMLYKKICAQIWNLSKFDEIAGIKGN